MPSGIGHTLHFQAAAKGCYTPLASAQSLKLEGQRPAAVGSSLYCTQAHRVEHTFVDDIPSSPALSILTPPKTSPPSAYHTHVAVCLEPSPSIQTVVTIPYLHCR
jgi:hypothetical protein